MLDFLLLIFGFVVIIVLVFSGILYFTASGSPARLGYGEEVVLMGDCRCRDWAGGFGASLSNSEILCMNICNRGWIQGGFVSAGEEIINIKNRKEVRGIL